ncbi:MULTISPECIES: TadE family protein [unclassified Microbacterium]|uniref:TadE family protein n=1 Tax=unclassified Microbacterium TaxID=2609290 RepID=UPI003017BF3F
MRSDDGSAALEFIVVGVILLVPLAYLVIALGAIQDQTLGAEAAARHTARATALAPDSKAAADAGDTVLAGVIDEYDLDPDTTEVELSCRPASEACPSAGVTLIVRVTARVRLPLVPPVLGVDRATEVPVQAEAVQKLSRTWGAP